MGKRISGLACRLCGSSAGRLVGYRTAEAGDGFSIVRCLQCGLFFADPFPDKAALRQLYGAGYFSCQTPLRGGYEDYRGDEPNIKRTFVRRLPLFLGYLDVSPPPRALDVGCATGAFLEVLRDLGWQVSGVDVAPFAVRIARQKGFDVAEGAVESAGFPPSSFDLITLWDVIEHMEDPLAALSACRRLLKPGGCLVLSTPDVSAWLADLLGRYWLGFRSVGEHLYFFDRRTISSLLEQAGFRVLDIRTVGKYMALERVFMRLSYYTRIFRMLPLKIGRFWLKANLYLNSGDTMCVIARRRQ